jgi:hypothetical protein
MTDKRQSLEHTQKVNRRRALAKASALAVERALADAAAKPATEPVPHEKPAAPLYRGDP